MSFDSVFGEGEVVLTALNSHSASQSTPVPEMGNGLSQVTARPPCPQRMMEYVNSLPPL